MEWEPESVDPDAAEQDEPPAEKLLYHASPRPLSAGRLRPRRDMEGGYADRAEDRGDAWVDLFIDEKGPGDPCRQTAFFAFDSVAEANYYASACRTDSPHIYEVRLHGKIARCPVVLSPRIRDRGAMSSQADEMAREYWAPRFPWRVYEYLGGTMEVVRQLPTPGVVDFDTIAVGERLSRDEELVLATWPADGSAKDPPSVRSPQSSAAEPPAESSNDRREEVEDELDDVHATGAAGTEAGNAVEGTTEAMPEDVQVPAEVMQPARAKI